MAAPHVYTVDPDARIDYPLTDEDRTIPLLPDGDFYDSNSFLIVGRDGSLIQLQCLCATVKPMYTHRPGVFLRVAGADGKELARYKNNFDTKELVIEGPNFRLPGFSFTFTGDGYVFKIESKDCPVSGEITVKVNEGGGVKFGEDGKIAFDEARTQFLKFFYTCPRGRATGRLTINKKIDFPVDGYMFASHFVSNYKAHYAAVRWAYAKFHSDDLAIVSTVMVTPKSFNFQQVSHGMVCMNEKLIATTVDSKAIYHTTVRDSFTGYDHPTDVTYSLAGHTLDAEGHKPISASIRLVPTRLLEKFDILGELPWALRIIIKAFLARPMHVQYLDRATATLTIGDTTTTHEGWLLHEATFINPE